MVEIYRGEDTDFAGAGPIWVEIDTPLDLTGFTADLLFGSVVKHFGAEEVATKKLGLIFTHEETSQFFPGKGFASIKVFDTEGRVAILKRFVIDVKFRKYIGAQKSRIGFLEAMSILENVIDVSSDMPTLTDSADLRTIKCTLNKLIEPCTQRREFTVPLSSEMSRIPESAKRSVIEVVEKLMGIASEVDNFELEGEIHDIKELLNRILRILRESKLTNREATSEVSMSEVADELKIAMRTQVV